MFKLNFIDKNQYEKEIVKSIDVIKTENNTLAPHIKEYLRIYLEDLIGKQKLYSGGLKIQTTLNIEMQIAAEKAFNSHIKKLKDKLIPEIDGALISIEGSTGAIKAMVGGYNFKQSQFNRAFKAKRQLGSTFKPVLYASAIKFGLSLTDTQIDEPLTLLDNNQEWSPQNFNHKFEGEMTLAQALSLSNNIIAIKTLLNIGVEKVINTAKLCGISETLHPYTSLALGCVESTALEAVALLNIFAQHGLLVEPYLLSWIKDEWDTKIYKHTPIKSHAISPIIADQICKALTISIERFKNRTANHGLNCQAMGKTGTTNDARTCWYTGATPQLTTCVYLGCDDNRSMGDDVLASRTAFPIWLDYTKKIGCEEKKFKFDPRLKEVMINAKTGRETHSQDPDSINILINDNFIN